MKHRNGFTLIEIIAVLAILGIVAAVAVAKYYDLQSEAKLQIAQAAVSSGLSACDLTFARTWLQGQTFSCADANDAVEYGYMDPDMVLTITNAGSGSGCLVQAVYGGQTASSNWTNPND